MATNERRSGNPTRKEGATGSALDRLQTIWKIALSCLTQSPMPLHPSSQAVTGKEVVEGSYETSTDCMVTGGSGNLRSHLWEVYGAPLGETTYLPHKKP